MLRGHVDSVTCRTIKGWAADEESPEEIVQVSIFVDGYKLAQIPCASPRPDLRQVGVFGQAPHGFAYEFPRTLGDGRDNRVSVRYATTGKLLNNGDAIVHRDSRVVMRTSPAGPGDGEPEQLPVPRDFRSMFEMLVLYDEKAGLYELLSRVQFSTEKPRNIYYSVFGRYPEGDLALHAQARRSQDHDYLPRDHMNELLLSREFQSNVVPLLLDAFPEKKRIVFIHIPKCAGTDLSANLSKRFPSMHQTIMEENWTPKERLFQYIAKLMANIRAFDSIFICGHSSLDYYYSGGLLRPNDDVFTIVRDPVDIAISHVNYIMTRLTSDMAAQRIGPDTKQWLDVLGIDTLPPDMPPELVQRLCGAILHSTTLVKPNSMCSWLGGSDAESAIEKLIFNDVEITTVDEYSRWLREHWGINTETRMNRSDAFVSLEALSQGDISYIQEIYAEDRKLYSIINAALARSGRSSIKGDGLR